MLDTKDTTYFSSNVQYSLLGHCINNRLEIALMFMRISKSLPSDFFIKYNYFSMIIT